MTVLAVIAAVLAGLGLLLGFLHAADNNLDAAKHYHKLSPCWAAVSALFFIAGRLP